MHELLDIGSNDVIPFQFKMWVKMDNTQGLDHHVTSHCSSSPHQEVLQRSNAILLTLAAQALGHACQFEKHLGGGTRSFVYYTSLELKLFEN